MTGPYHTILSLYGVLKDYESFKYSVKINKAKIIHLMGNQLIYPIQNQPLLCTYIKKKLTSKDLKSFIREKISPQKTPAVWIEVDEWPLTGSGKIKKYALREQLSDGSLKVLT